MRHISLTTLVFKYNIQKNTFSLPSLITTVRAYGKLECPIVVNLVHVTISDLLTHGLMSVFTASNALLEVSLKI